MQETPTSVRRRRQASGAALVLLVLAAFCVVFVLLDQGYVRLTDSSFPRVGESWTLATAFGLVSRLHLILPLLALALWQPRVLGLQLGQTRRHLRLLVLMLVVNCGVVGGYLTLTAGPTPFSGDQWLLTEVVTVPVVEETMWAERSSRPCSPRSGAAARDARRPRRPCGRAASPSASMVLHAAMNLTVVLV